MRVGSIGETITVSGVSPIVDVQNVSQQRVATREVMDSVPVGKNFQSLGVLIPGVVTAGQTGSVPPGRGRTVGQQSHEPGDSRRPLSDQHMHVDGMSVEVFTRSDGSAMWFPDTNYQEYVFDYSANSPEVETGGVRVNMIPARAATSSAAASSSTSRRSECKRTTSMTTCAPAALADVNRAEELWTLNVRLGGPLKRDRLWFVATHSRMAADTYRGQHYFRQGPAGRLYVPDSEPAGRA